MKVNKPKPPPLRVGEEVGIIDGSYMITIFNNQYCNSSSNIRIIGKNRDIWKILSYGHSVSPINPYGIDRKNIINNIAIKNTINGEVWFCSDINIKRVDEWDKIIRRRNELNNNFNLFYDDSNIVKDWVI